MVNKKLLTSITAGLIFTGSVQATVVDSADVGGLHTFKDTSTGYIWLDMNNFYDSSATTGTTGYDMIAAATSRGFTIATGAQVHQLLDSLPLTGEKWSSYAAVMGGINPRELIWGMYDNGDASSAIFPWAWSFSTDTTWNIGSTCCTDANGVQNAGSDGNVDMGIWAVSAVPEPETYAMLLAGLGLLGFAGLRNKTVV